MLTATLYCLIKLTVEHPTAIPLDELATAIANDADYEIKFSAVDGRIIDTELLDIRSNVPLGYPE